MKQRNQRGFTLIETMVVVAILAILAALVIPTVRSSTKPIDVARRVANLVEHASRDAVRAGPAGPTVVASEGSKRRTRVRGAAGPVFILEFLDSSGDWSEITRYQVPASVVSDGYALSVGTYSALSTTLSADWDAFEISCFPSGTCTGATLFFSTTRGLPSDRQARLSVLPLGAATYVRSSWE